MIVEYDFERILSGFHGRKKNATNSHNISLCAAEICFYAKIIGIIQMKFGWNAGWNLCIKQFIEVSYRWCKTRSNTDLNGIKKNKCVSIWDFPYDSSTFHLVLKNAYDNDFILFFVLSSTPIFVAILFSQEKLNKKK